MILSGIVEKIRTDCSPTCPIIFRVIGTLVLFFSFNHLSAQEFGGNPPSIKWKQINTDTARIIFPAGIDSIAREVSSVVHLLAYNKNNSLGNRIRKVNIVLQNQPTISNGYVSLGPFRSEFYLTPRQNSFELGSLPWHKSLALHEYRHVEQYSNFRKGASKIFYYLFGEEGQALANAFAVPDWFWEGDAVYQETVMSNQGRGKIPYFFNAYRSLWAAGKNYSWMKLRNGSYRDFTPDHYELGYLLVNYGYKKFGNDVWGKVTNDAVRFRPLLNPFQKSFKNNTGQSFSSFAKEAIQQYQNNGAQITDSGSSFAASQKHFAADELYPYWIDNDNIVYLKSTYKHIPAFYLKNINTGSEKKIRNKSISTTNYFSYGNGKIVYAAYQPHPRWGWKNYEVIKVLDIESSLEKTITTHSRYLSPAISDEGDKIVAVHAGEDGKNNLHILNAITGKMISAVPTAQQFVYTYPRFYKADNIVSAVRNNKGEMALGNIKISTGEIAWLTGFANEAIAFPLVKGDTIFYSKTQGNADRLFAWVQGKTFLFEPDNKNISTGNYLLSAGGGMYTWSMFTAAGFKIFSGTGKFTAVNNTSNILYQMLVPQTKVNLVSAPSIINAPVEKYNSAFRLFNFHSWRPYFSDPEYSYSVIGNNILNTLQSEIYFTYNRNERFKETGASLSYAAWFPVLTGGASFTFDRSFTDTARRNTWNEFNAKAGFNIPLHFTSGTFSQSLNAGASFNTKQVYYTGASKQQFDNKQFNYGEYFFSFTNQQLKARQNIHPRFAQAISARYRHILNRYTANQFLISGNIYLPGIFRNHNLVLQASYQRRDTLQQYNFSNPFPVSRGYPDIDFPRMWKLGANYHFPLAYPDAGIGNIVYLLRLRSNVFYDYSRVKSLRTGMQTTLTALGTELFFDTRWWNQLPVSFGIRYSRLLDADRLRISPNQWELVLPMNILSR